MKEKAVFLDIDGVICLYLEWQQDWVSNQNDRLDEFCCKNLKAILDDTGARIVISSSWRLNESYLSDLHGQLEKFGITKEYIAGSTENLSSDKRIKTHNELRWLEIKDYLDRYVLEQYIILDDFNLEKYDKPHLIKTKRHEGLTSKLKDVCIEKLKLLGRSDDQKQ